MIEIKYSSTHSSMANNQGAVLCAIELMQQQAGATKQTPALLAEISFPVSQEKVKEGQDIV